MSGLLLHRSEIFQIVSTDSKTVDRAISFLSSTSPCENNFLKYLVNNLTWARVSP